MKKRAEGFIVAVQNASGIIEDMSAKRRKRYFNAIDAISMESLFFNIYSSEDQRYRLEMLQRYAGKGKKVFNVEYIPESQYDNYRDKLDAASVAMVGYAAEPDAALDELTHFDW